MSLTASLLPGVPLVDSPFFEQDARTQLSDEQYRIARQLHDRGYAVIDFPDKHLFEKIDTIVETLKPRYEWEEWKAGRKDSLRIQDAWRFLEPVKDIAANRSVIGLLSAVYGREAFPFQTLNFPVGTQQAAHCDHVHFDSVPERFMCGVWLAMEDIDDRNGPLFYYPGSHKWPSYQNEHVGVSASQIRHGFPEYHRFVDVWTARADAENLKRDVFHARKGQALIWTSNVLHGGSPQTDLSRTRWSQVTHYFFKGCRYTTPVANDVYGGKIFWRDTIDIRSGEIVPNFVSQPLPAPDDTWTLLRKLASKLAGRVRHGG